MVIEEIKSIKSERNDLRKFGMTMGMVFMLLGGLFWWRGKDYSVYFLVISILFLFLSFIIPFFLKPIHKIWMSLAVLMSWIVTRIMLCALFYLGITPISLLARLFRKDFLGINFNKKSTTSYWIPKERRKFDRSDYEKQF